jgi:MSHA biogenesis protein MshN
MSVINKMLKDLESEQEVEVSPKGNILLSKKNNSWIIILIFLAIIIVILSYFLKISYNQQSITQSILNDAENKQIKAPKITPNPVLENQAKALQTVGLADNKQAKQKLEPSPITLTKVVPEKTPQTSRLEEPNLNVIKVENTKKQSPKISKKSLAINKQKETSTDFKKPSDKKVNSQQIFKKTKSKINSKQQAQRFWNEAEKQPQYAEKFLSKALVSDGSLHGARLQLIALLVTQKRLTEAERMADKGLILSPRHPGYIEWKARMRIAANDAKTALQWLLKTTPDLEQHINYYGILASIASQLKYNDIAAETYLKLSNIQPKYGPWLLGMAISEERLGNDNNAKDYYQKAKSANGLTPRARIFIQQKLDKLES